MLANAGVEVEVVRPLVDEDAVKWRHDGNASKLALRLAQAKAISVDSPGDLIIGSDSTLSVGGKIFSKPRDRADAAAHLAAFSGHEMILSSAAAVARDGVILWSYVDQARLKVRNLSPDFIKSYLDAEWPDVAYCVGVFRMEGRGISLFDTVEGSHFTILGMPLLPLLAALRGFGAVAA